MGKPPAGQGASTYYPGGRKVQVYVERAVFESGRLHLLVRRGAGDLILGASASLSVVEALQRRLGPSQVAYEIATVPVSESTDGGPLNAIDAVPNEALYRHVGEHKLGNR